MTLCEYVCACDYFFYNYNCNYYYYYYYYDYYYDYNYYYYYHYHYHYHYHYSRVYFMCNVLCCRVGFYVDYSADQLYIHGQKDSGPSACTDDTEGC